MSKTEQSESPDAFPEILNTGSMLNLADELAEDVPSRLGPYRMLRRIGEGGMGVVYLAEQDPPLVRLVAIKLARNAVRGDRALARFDSERQTLAVMNHPNIARVFDAGSTPDGRPYFVMEYVAGEAINAFCDARGLGIESRLELFLQVCDGVQHAHLNAVIHRDLKPANILVTSDSGSPTPKIIDFGVAKALGHGAAGASALTQFGQLVGTPEYMSPEQAALDGRPVDSRTDVYSLGVVLYELLAGARPFEREEGPDASFVDLCRRIREEEPKRPSARATRASTLARRLRGDLDAITLKALAKDPRSRYGSPSEFAADVERHLAHHPVHARPPGPFVRVRKAIRRHRREAAVAGVLSACLIGLAIVGTAQALRARREAARAENEARVGNEIRQFVLTVIDRPGALGSYDVPSKILTSQDQEIVLNRIREQFADQPLIRAQLLFAVSNHLLASSGSTRELGTLEESRNQITALIGPDSDDALTATENLARTYTFSGRPVEAERLFLDALGLRRHRNPDDPGIWRATAQLAIVHKFQGRHDRAVPLFEAAIAGLAQELGPDHADVLSTRVGLSGSYLELRRYRETRALLDQSIDDIRRVFGKRDYITQIALYNLACVHANSDRVDLAFDYLRQSTDAGWSYPYTIARDPLLLPLHGEPRFDELTRVGRLNRRELWAGQLLEAQIEIRQGRLAEADRRLVDLVAAVGRVDGPEAEGWAVFPRLALAKCRVVQGRFDDAEAMLLRILAAARAAGRGGEEWRSLDLLAQCDLGRGDRESAIARIAATDHIFHAVFDNVEKGYAAAEIEALRGRSEEALRTLARISELGFEDYARLEHDLAFVTLRGRPEFQRIVAAARKRTL